MIKSIIDKIEEKGMYDWVFLNDISNSMQLLRRDMIKSGSSALFGIQCKILYR